jgi:hypothetical protein
LSKATDSTLAAQEGGAVTGANTAKTKVMRQDIVFAAAMGLSFGLQN